MAVKSSYRVFLKFLIVDCSDCYRLKIAPFKIPKVQKKKKKKKSICSLNSLKLFNNFLTAFQ